MYATSVLMFLCVSCTALGRPVVPLENKMAAVSSTGLMLSWDRWGKGVVSEGIDTNPAYATQPGWGQVDMMVCNKYILFDLYLTSAWPLLDPKGW